MNPLQKPPKKLSRNWRVVVAHMNPDDQYAVIERLGILCGTTEPPPDSAVLIALEQVRTKP